MEIEFLSRRFRDCGLFVGVFQSPKLKVCGACKTNYIRFELAANESKEEERTKIAGLARYSNRLPTAVVRCYTCLNLRRFNCK